MQVPMALKRMSPEEFGSVKESFRLQLLQAPLSETYRSKGVSHGLRSTNDEFDRFWEPIRSTVRPFRCEAVRLGGCFNASEEMLSYLEHVKCLAGKICSRNSKI